MLVQVPPPKMLVMHLAQLLLLSQIVTITIYPEPQLLLAIHALLDTLSPQQLQHAQLSQQIQPVDNYILMAHVAPAGMLIIGTLLHASLQLLLQFYQLYLWLF